MRSTVLTLVQVTEYHKSIHTISHTLFTMSIMETTLKESIMRYNCIQHDNHKHMSAKYKSVQLD